MNQYQLKSEKHSSSLVNERVIVGIIDYQSGNLHSAKKGVEKALGMSEKVAGEVRLVSSSDELEDITHIILPGVGAFYDCFSGLSKISGIIERMEEKVFNDKCKFLGICVGMQILAERGYEKGEHKGLGWLKGLVIKIPNKQGDLKLPHMGWNEVTLRDKSSKLFGDIEDNSDFYFVHSYFMSADSHNILAEVDYGQQLTAAVLKDNIAGVQFHPEKSQINGLKLLTNFVEW